MRKVTRVRWMLMATALLMFAVAPVWAQRDRSQAAWDRFWGGGNNRSNYGSGGYNPSAGYNSRPNYGYGGYSPSYGGNYGQPGYGDYRGLSGSGYNNRPNYGSDYSSGGIPVYIYNNNSNVNTSRSSSSSSSRASSGRSRGGWGAEVGNIISAIGGLGSSYMMGQSGYYGGQGPYLYPGTPYAGTGGPIILPMPAPTTSQQPIFFVQPTQMPAPAADPPVVVQIVPPAPFSSGPAQPPVVIQRQETEPQGPQIIVLVVPAAPSETTQQEADSVRGRDITEEEILSLVRSPDPGQRALAMREAPKFFSSIRVIAAVRNAHLNDERPGIQEEAGKCLEQMRVRFNEVERELSGQTIPGQAVRAASQPASQPATTVPAERVHIPAN